MKAKALTEYEEQQRMIRKMEGKFLTLLEDHFYLSDHIGIQWEDAKKTLQKRSAYDAVGKSDRKRLFQKHMENLAAKMEAKTKSMKLLIDSRDHSSSNTEHAPPVGDGHSEQGPVVVPDGVAANKDSSTEALYDIEKEMQEDSDSDKEKEKGRDKDRDKHSKKDKDKEKDKDKHKKDKKHKKVLLCPISNSKEVCVMTPLSILLAFEEGAQPQHRRRRRGWGSQDGRGPRRCQEEIAIRLKLEMRRQSSRQISKVSSF